MTASILIVEDEEPIQVLLSYNFEAEGFRARSCATGEDVPRFVGEERPKKDTTSFTIYESQNSQ